MANSLPRKLCRVNQTGLADLRLLYLANPAGTTNSGPAWREALGLAAGAGKVTDALPDYPPGTDRTAAQVTDSPRRWHLVLHLGSSVHVVRLCCYPSADSRVNAPGISPFTPVPADAWNSGSSRKAGIHHHSYQFDADPRLARVHSGSIAGEYLNSVLTLVDYKISGGTLSCLHLLVVDGSVRTIRSFPTVSRTALCWLTIHTPICTTRSHRPFSRPIVTQCHLGGVSIWDR